MITKTSSSVAKRTATSTPSAPGQPEVAPKGKIPTSETVRTRPKDTVTLSKESVSSYAQTPKPVTPTGSNVDVEAITKEPDKIKRNQEVTQGYHEIQKGLDEVINPPGSPDGGANWGTHAVWASRQAGDAIQGKGMPSVGTGQVKEAISEGNTKVFKDVAPDMRDFAKEFANSDKFDEEKFDKWADRFQGEDAQLKKEAFESYYKARFEQDHKKKQEMVLYGNIKIGEYEQSQLDPDIDKAMTPSGPEGLIARGLVNSNPIDLLTGRNPLRELGTSGIPGISDPMNLSHPDGQGGTRKAEFNKDVPGSPSENLRTIQDPKLRAAMEKYGIDPDKADGGSSATRDWSEFDDRMGWITQHFRNNQMNREMVSKNPQPDVAVNLPRTDGSDLMDSPMPVASSDSESAFLSAFMSNYMAAA